MNPDLISFPLHSNKARLTTNWLRVGERFGQMSWCASPGFFTCWNGFAVSVSQGVLCLCLTSSLAPDGVAVTSDPCHRGDSFCMTMLLA